MSRASYHLCKLIETVALDYPFDCSGGMPENNTTDGFSIGSLLDKNRALWVRFFWLSGKLSIFNDDKEKAQKEFGVALALFTAKDKESNPLVFISLPHLKVINELTVDWVVHELNLLEVGFFDEKQCKTCTWTALALLSPLLFCMKDDRVAVSAVLNKDGEGVSSAELSALNVVIKAYERSKQMDAIVYLRCHRRKLRLLMSATGVEECFGSQKLSTFPKPRVLAASETELTENSSTVLHPLLSEEVKAISQCTLETRNSFSPCGSINCQNVKAKYIGVCRYRIASLVALCIRVCSGSGFTAAAPGSCSLNGFPLGASNLKDATALEAADAVVVPLGFGDRGVQEKIIAAKYARENNILYLEICLGMQIVVIDYARSVVDLEDANSTEFYPKTENPCYIYARDPWAQAV
ncbi:hypothetical protein OSB04_030109 [Centaurea solstitialis]|uniref:CTP synthase (glutamine hydrolyzing) n=1 Tax=Centaurea solstitialis TaxID=347529 RepID=A0AA38SK02_9ASTR|nr:hypothetical protein OSB04_030109 [Centaurea solstitialis]